jgi:hypothetical protein
MAGNSPHSPLGGPWFTFRSWRASRLILAAALAWAAISVSPAFARPAEVETEDGAILCMRPFELSQAIAAVKAHNAAWLKELACVQIGGGIRATLVRPDAPLAQPWQARIFPPAGRPEGVTVWGYSTSFRMKGGKAFWPGR